MALTAVRTASPFWPRNTLSSTITSTADALTSSAGEAQSVTVIRVTCSGGAIDLFSTPAVHAGFHGQPLEIMNVGSNVLTLEDEQSQPGSLLKLGGYPRVNLAQYQSATFTYVTDGSLNKWVLTSDVSNLACGLQTAHAGGGQGSATPIYWPKTRVSAVNTNGDSVLLWPALGTGICVRVMNVDGASNNYCELFPTSGDAIDGMAANQPISINPNTGVTLIDSLAGMWRTC